MYQLLYCKDKVTSNAVQAFEKFFEKIFLN